MNFNEDELQKELKELKTSVSLDPQKKESMKNAIRKHAKKKRKRKKLKQSAIWFSTAAVLFICGVLLVNTINSNQSVLPADDHDQPENKANTGDTGKEAADSGQEGDTDDTASQQISVSEQGTETQTIMLEGTEKETTVTNYSLEPYGIYYQMDEFLGNYTIDEGAVRHYSDDDNAWIRLEVIEDVSLDDVVSDVQSDYSGDASETEESAETPPGEENPYHGIGQHFSSPPQGYYVYQIEENVLVIQYEYVIAAGDGMGSRLQALRESISQ
ncbi:hypothetical protein SAMN04488072_11513 [Lentibacillus halodurans]|uniref:DUF4367 domain-containing protein n=1 Tax=Lentibacillus halodurans TaxID=237679 RepID=A0A1I1A3H9_9BACI|nr:hypothetical protein [Lentibacillus halodurans]SFB31138.1 hypothetical protein SAMN04488072_11513 [Lentibacillus halodurans]